MPERLACNTEMSAIQIYLPLPFTFSFSSLPSVKAERLANVHFINTVTN